MTVSDGGRGRIFVPVPFDADAIWGPKPRHPVGGTLNGTRVRGVVQLHDGVQGLLVGPSWLRGCDLSPGDQSKVYLEPEGSQRQHLADDIAAALQANPRAAQFFDGLAQFYRRGTCGGSTRRSAARSCDKNESPRWSSSLRPGSRTTTPSERLHRGRNQFRAVSASVRDARECRPERTVMPHGGIKWTPPHARSGRATCSCPLSTSQRTASSTAS